MCTLYSLCKWCVAGFGRPLTPELLLENFEELGLVGFFVARVGDQVVGTVSYRLVGGQKAADPDGLWVDDLVIHPSFRASQVTGLLLAEAAKFAVGRGFSKIHTHVDVENLPALRLYRRIGFRRVGPACSDDTVPFDNYLPTVARYIAMCAGIGDAELIHLDEVLGSDLLTVMMLTVPPIGHDPGGLDVEHHKEATVLRYRLDLSWDVGFECLVDTALSRVTAITGGRWQMDVQPRHRSVAVGEEVLLEYTLHNGSDHDEQVVIAASFLSDDTSCLVSSEVKRGAAVQGVFLHMAPRSPGRQEIVIRIEIPSEALCVELVTWIEAKAEGRRAATMGRSAQVFDDPFMIETGTLRLLVNPSTGHLDISTSCGELLVRDLWPDVGPPFPGGFKKPAQRSIRVLPEGSSPASLAHESSASTWVDRARGDLVRSRHTKEYLASLLVQRRVVAAGSTIVIESRVVRRADSTEAPEVVSLRTYPWAYDAEQWLTVPLASGTFAAPLVYQGFPFLFHNWEGIPSADLPHSPDAYSSPWASLFNGRVRLVSVWPGATEVRFGLRWFPSAIYTVPPLLPGQATELPLRSLIVDLDGTIDPGAFARESTLEWLS